MCSPIINTWYKINLHQRAISVLLALSLYSNKSVKPKLKVKAGKQFAAGTVDMDRNCPWKNQLSGFQCTASTLLSFHAEVLSRNRDQSW